MSEWDGWELGRVVVLLVAVMYLGMWVQVSLFHWRRRFEFAVMLAPVLLTPFAALFVALAAIARGGVLGLIAFVFLGATALLGLVGLSFHLRGVRRRFGGLSLRNLSAGPPPMLPFAYSMTGVLGLIALGWDGR